MDHQRSAELSASETPSPSRSLSLKEYHLSLLSSSQDRNGRDTMDAPPVFTANVLENLAGRGTPDIISQYGLLAGVLGRPKHETASLAKLKDPRVFFNISHPSSTFICGSQGSGKSHTLACLLENALIQSDATELARPLTGLVFHYDTFISDLGDSPCEAAYLSTSDLIKVRVLCSPTNIRTIQKTYARLNVQVEPLRIDQEDLNTRRMLDLMAVSSEDGSQPLYIQTVNRILRSMRLAQQESGTAFDYHKFKRNIEAANLTPPQRAPLDQRLGMLESFMPDSQARYEKKGTKSSAGKRKSVGRGTLWDPEAAQLTIVDLSCPCMTPEMACSLFNICLSIFLEQDATIGRIVALDEAHKYMNTSSEAAIFTNTLLATVRLQRHLGVRVIVSTQEPTISPALLDLSSVTIVHRFTSPDWLQSLKAHVAPAASQLLSSIMDAEADGQQKSTAREQPTANEIARGIFSDIVSLRTGEALLFAPNALVTSNGSRSHADTQRLGFSYLKVKIRARITADGGRSVLSD